MLFVRQGGTVMTKSKQVTINVQGTSVAVVSRAGGDYISLTDMLKAKDGDFFIADWLHSCPVKI